ANGTSSRNDEEVTRTSSPHAGRMPALREVGLELTQRNLKVFRHDARIRKRGHETCIAAPSRNNEEMIVLFHTGAGRTSEIHSRIKSIRMIHFAKSKEGALI